MEYEWGPKGHSQLPMHQRAFPLDEDYEQATKVSVIDTDFDANYSDDDNKDIIEAVKSLDPYLHPRNQILLQALIKVNSVLHDINTLVKVSSDVSINEYSVKPMTVREGIQIAKEMSPYLSSNTKRQLETITYKIDTISRIKADFDKVKTAETAEIKAEYILNTLKLFMRNEKYNQIKQIVNIVKVLQTSSQLSDAKKSLDEEELTEDLDKDVDQEELTEDLDKNVDEEVDKSADTENDQLADIMNLLDKFSK